MNNIEDAGLSRVYCTAKAGIVKIMWALVEGNMTAECMYMVIMQHQVRISLRWNET